MIPQIKSLIKGFKSPQQGQRQMNHRQAQYFSPMAHIRNHHPFARLMASVVIVTFLALALEPAILGYRAAQAAPPAITPATQSDEAKLSNKIQKAISTLDVMQYRLENNNNISQAQKTLNDLRLELVTLDKAVSANFDNIAKHIKQKKLPDVIMQRHQKTVTEYKDQIKTVLQNLRAVKTASNRTKRTEAIKKAKTYLKSKKHKRSNQPFDPNNLPNKSLQPNPTNKPKENKMSFIDDGLRSNPLIKVAALGDFTFDRLPGADNPAYLAATAEVTLSDAIKAKASELNHDPIKIYHWVRNNTQWQPAWGAMQDADLTLNAQRGNAFDIASLQIALLRASGIPARYVHGTIDVPEEKFRNWVGGFTNLFPAMDFAASGGIPITPVTSGGKIIKVRLEHIWVEAAIDYQPSKGAKNIAADSWVEMDPSYKQYEYLQGLDSVAISGIDPEALAQQFVDSGTVNETEGWVSGFDPSILQNAQQQTQAALEQYITDNLPNATVGDVIGGAKTIIQEYPVLASSLPNRIVVTGTRYGALPDTLQHKMSFSFNKEQIDAITYPWAKLNNQKVTLSFKPAAADDEAALASLLPEGDITDISQLPTSIPAYLIKVIPELAVNEVVVKQGTPMSLGEELPFTFGITYRGHGDFPYTYNVIAGSYLSVAVIGGNISPNLLIDLKSNVIQTKTALESGNAVLIGALDREKLLGDFFYAGTLGYYAQYITLSEFMGKKENAYHYLAAGYGTFGYEAHVNYIFNIPRTVNTGGAVMNIPILNVLGSDSSLATTAKTKNYFNLQIGSMSSALEHTVLEQMFTTDLANPANAISSMKALSKASAEGQRIYTITQTNQATVLPNINLDYDTMAEIQNALSVGKEIITHSDAVTVPGWSGAGYIILDPLTGDGAYKISGGQNGGFLLILLGLLIAGIALYLLLPVLIPLVTALIASMATILAPTAPFTTLILSLIGLPLYINGLFYASENCAGAQYVITIGSLVLTTIATIFLYPARAIQFLTLDVAFVDLNKWIVDNSCSGKKQ